MLLASEIEGAVRDESGRWQIPRHAVHTMLEQRQQGEPQGVHQSKDVEKSAPEASAKALVEAAAERQELQERLEGLQRQLGCLEGRLELEELTQSTLLEALERERQRAEVFQWEAQRLRRRLEYVQKLPRWRCKLFGS
jgi:chromosome segregation ATPase